MESALQLAWRRGHAQVLRQQVAVHFQSEGEIRGHVVAKKLKNHGSSRFEKIKTYKIKESGKVMSVIDRSTGQTRVVSKISVPILARQKTAKRR
jgi:hypothetical protein